MSKLRAGAASFTFNPSASVFVPRSVAPAAAPEPVVAPVVEAAPQASVPADNGSWEQAEPATEAKVEAKVEAKAQETTFADEEDLDISDPAVLAALGESDPELLAELLAVQAEERKAKQDKQAAAERRRAKQAAAAEAREAGLVRVDAREHMNIVFIGHVDAGKSTISGQIMMATGQIDERTIDRYKKEAEEKGRDSWYLAFILDSNDEEKAKGKTVEVGRAHFTTNTKRYTLLDAPGHKNYVPNMIGGAQQADVGVLVISARKGEFETGFDRGGQTREHAMLAKTLGIKRLIVLVNKMDEKTVNWDQKRFDQIETKLSPFLKKSGFDLKREVTYCPVSGYSGQNISHRHTGCEWYSGPCFLEILDQLPAINRETEKPARIPVITRFKDMGSLMVLGKLEAGTLRKGDELILMPTRKRCSVRELIVDEEEVDIVLAGENVLVKVTGLNEEDVADGMVLCEAERCALRTAMFDCQIQVLDLLAHKPILTSGYQAVLHVHSLNVECEITKLIEEVKVERKKKTKSKTKSAGGTGKKKGKGKKKSAQVAAPEKEAAPEKKAPKGPAPVMLRTGDNAIVRIRTRNLITVETFADQQALGRFTLRDQGVTIAIGKILKIAQPRSKN
jgi:peptide chain release factor subunit 3